MRIHLLSDLHHEFGGPLGNYTPPDVDIVLLAGDIAEDYSGIDWARETFDVPVLYTPGNHEFYDSKQIASWLGDLRAYAEGSNVHVMHNDTFELEGVQFVAATLWTDFNLYGRQRMHQYDARKGLNDYRYIRRPSSTRSNRKLRTEDTLQSHVQSRAYIREAIERYSGKTVVMTHHAPSEQSVPSRRRANILTPAYASNLERFIEELKPVLWTHGHIHSSSDYIISDTRVVCNPRGYFSRKDTNPDFDPQLVIEI